MKSTYAKGMAGITPADISVLYFAVQFIIYLLGCWYQSYLQTILLFAFGGIAISALSIYTQATKIKQWCALCLGIVAVLLLQNIISIIEYNGVVNYKSLIIFIALLLILSIPLLLIKKLIKTNSSNKIKLAELKKWKLDAGLFINQWKQEQQVDIRIWESDLVLGNPNASLQITVACSPYCGPCANAHALLDNLLHRFANKIKVQLRLLSNADYENDKATIAVKAILQKAVALQSTKELEEMLTDWFESMDYDKWANKWKPDSTDVSERIKEHSQWMKESSIAFTPTFFINGRKMPGRYSLSDLEILMPQLTELLSKNAIN